MSNAKHVTDELSAYLDHELSRAERARVEAHLRTCAQCQRDVESLRYTMQLMRELPPMHAPRAFTLAPEQAARLRPWWQAGWLVNSLRAMTALTALLLILTVSADLLLLSAPRSAPQPASVPAAAMNAPTQPSAAEKAQPPTSRDTTSTGAAAAPTSASAPYANAATPVTQATSEARVAQATVTPSAQTTRSPIPSGVQPTATATPPPTATPTLTPLPTATPMPSATPSPTASATPEPTLAPAATQADTPPSTTLGLRLIEAGLLGLLLLGMGALYVVRLASR